MITQLLSATTSAGLGVPGRVTLAVLLFLGWRLLLVWRFPYAPAAGATAAANAAPGSTGDPADAATAPAAGSASDAGSGTGPPATG